MNFEAARNYFARNFISAFATSRKDIEEGKEKYPYYFYADTSKSTGETQIFPEKWQGKKLEDIETEIDAYLFKHWSLYESPQMHWPHLRTVVDPAKDSIYRIVEFPVVIDSKRQLAVKQAITIGEKLQGLTYRFIPL